MYTLIRSRNRKKVPFPTLLRSRIGAIEYLEKTYMILRNLPDIELCAICTEDLWLVIEFKDGTETRLEFQKVV